MKRLIIPVLMIFLLCFSFTTISAREVTCSDDGVISVWHLNTDGTISDECGVSGDGTIVNATYTSEGKYNGAYVFTEINNEHINFGNDTSLNFGTNNFSVSLWVKSSNYANDGIMEKWDNSNAIGFAIYQQKSGAYNWYSVSVGDGSSDEELSTDGAVAPQFTIDTWYNLVLTREGDDFKLYQNNELADNITLAGFGDMSVPEKYFYISQGGWGTFNGTIDEIAVFNKTLSEAEILELYTDVAEEEPSYYIQGSGTIYEVMNSGGAGLGIFMHYLGLALPVLLILLAIVGIIVAVGISFGKIFQKFDIHIRK